MQESMSNLLVNRDQEDQAVADDLLRLEAEAASIKAIMKRRQSELSSHLGYIVRWCQWSLFPGMCDDVSSSM